MSLLSAADRAIEARRLVYQICNRIHDMGKGNNNQQELLTDCRVLADQVNNVVRELEQALVRDNETVAVTFFPFRRKTTPGGGVTVRERETGYTTGNSSGGRSTGTLILPSESSENDPA